jgi:hypothetical protein
MMSSGGREHASVALSVPMRYRSRQVWASR